MSNIISRAISPSYQQFEKGYSKAEDKEHALVGAQSQAMGLSRSEGWDLYKDNPRVFASKLENHEKAHGKVEVKPDPESDSKSESLSGTDDLEGTFSEFPDSVDRADDSASWDDVDDFHNGVDAPLSSDSDDSCYEEGDLDCSDPDDSDHDDSSYL